MSAMEYRLRWQRVGLGPVTRIFQTERGVLDKANRMLALDEAKHFDDENGPSPFAGMPDLVWMRLEERPVGEWAASGTTFDVPEPDPDSAPCDERTDAIPW